MSRSAIAALALASVSLAAVAQMGGNPPPPNRPLTRPVPGVPPIDMPSGRQPDLAPADGPTANFRRLDLDGDGKLSREEARGDAALVARFDTLDRNGDSRLDEQELTASAATAPPARK